MSRFLEQYGRLVTAGLVAGFILFALMGCEPAPTQRQCDALRSSQAAVNLCLQVKGCFITSGDLLRAMEDGQKMKAVGCET